eukprot:2673055-Pleurochrysis_carterae.AAC.3
MPSRASCVRRDVHAHTTMRTQARARDMRALPRLRRPRQMPWQRVPCSPACLSKHTVVFLCLLRFFSVSLLVNPYTPFTPFISKRVSVRVARALRFVRASAGAARGGGGGRGARECVCSCAAERPGAAADRAAAHQAGEPVLSAPRFKRRHSGVVEVAACAKATDHCVGGFAEL